MWHSPRPGGKPGVDGRSGDYSGEALVLQAIFPFYPRPEGVPRAAGCIAPEAVGVTPSARGAFPADARREDRLSGGAKLRALGAVVAISLGLAIATVFGRPAILIETPRPGDEIGVGGARLFVRFEPDGAVDPATVRILLNGADVTRECLVAGNGVSGDLHGLLDGENRVRVEARVRRPGGVFRDESREVRVRFRPPPAFDRG